MEENVRPSDSQKFEIKHKRMKWFFFCTMHVQCLRRPEEAVRIPATGVTGTCELLCGGWKLNTSPVEEQLVAFFLICFF